MLTYIIVDDEPLTVKGTVKKLEGLEDRLRFAGDARDGEEGLRLVDRVVPDIVITDMNMPNMDGVEFLQKLRGRYPDMPVVIISGYQDFTYAKQALGAGAFNYLLKPFSRQEIVDTMEEVIAHLEKGKRDQAYLESMEASYEFIRLDRDIRLLQDLILGRQRDGVLESRRLAWMQRGGQIQLAALYAERSMRAEFFQTYIEDNNLGDFLLYLDHPTSKQMGFCILFSPDRSSLGDRELADTVCRDFCGEYRGQDELLNIGVSLPKAGLTLLHGAYNEAVAALDADTGEHRQAYRVFSPGEPSAAPKWDGVDALLFRVEAGQADLVREQLTELFAFGPAAGWTLREMKRCLTYLSGRIRVSFQEYMQLEATDNMGSVERNLSTMYSFADLERFSTFYFVNLANNMRDYSIYTDDVVENLKKYISRHYARPLNQEFLASLFFLNRSYMSHLFKKQTGEKLVDYITQCRMDKARELLLQTDKRMYQIAREVGFENDKYFFRIFKKRFGVTPEQFRSGETAPQTTER